VKCVFDDGSPAVMPPPPPLHPVTPRATKAIVAMFRQKYGFK